MNATTTLEQDAAAYRKAVAAGANLAARDIKKIMIEKQQQQQQAAQAQQAQQAAAMGPPVPPVEPESTLTSRASDVFQERKASIADTLSRPVATEAEDILGTQQQGALSFSDKLVRTAGDLVGGFGDIAGDALMTGAAAMTPDFILEGVGNSF